MSEAHRPGGRGEDRKMPMDKPTCTNSGIIPIIPDFQNPRIQVTIWDASGETAGLWERVREVAKLLRHEERTQSNSETLSYAHLCGALVETLESFGAKDNGPKEG